jgi:acetyl-CoA acetyltransferase
MSDHPFRDVAIVGVYNTPQTRHPEGRTSAWITLDAVRGALDDAGLSLADVDGFAIRQTDPRRDTQSESATLGHALGLDAFWVGGPRLGIPALINAAEAISSGQCHTVVVASGEAWIHEGKSTPRWVTPENEFVECWGLYTAAQFALVARRHMSEFGTTPEQLAFVAATIRNNGSVNPAAIGYGSGPFTVADVLASPMIADPFHRLDCCMSAVCGGAALVLTSADRATGLRRTPTYMLGAAVESSGPTYTHPPALREVGLLGRRAAATAFAMGGLTPGDVDVCEFYDAFSFEIIRQFEAYGFCEVGEGGGFVEAGEIGLDGRFPICTDGGALAHSHTGASQVLQKIVQSVRQVRGDAPNQIDGAEVAICSTAGSAARMNPVLIVGSSRP